MKWSATFAAKEKRGATLFEVLLVVAIIAAMAGVSAPFFRDFIATNDLSSTSATTLAMLRRSRALALSGRRDTPWGVAVRTAERTVTLFAGPSFAGRDPQFDETIGIPKTLSFSGTIDEAVFSKQSGLPNVSGDMIFLAPALNDSITLRIHAQGLIAFE